MMQGGDHDLLQRTVRGDEAAARALWACWGGRMTALAEGLLRFEGGHAAACDVVQSVFCRILTLDRGAVAAVEDVGAWLARAVRNESLNYIRAGDRRRAHTAAAGMRSGRGAEGFEELRAALGALPEALREIVLLKHVGGLTFDQVSVALGEHRSTIVSRYQKALELMRRWAAGGAGGGAAREEVRV